MKLRIITELGELTDKVLDIDLCIIKSEESDPEEVIGVLWNIDPQSDSEY